jgi:hypothetical protein
MPCDQKSEFGYFLTIPASPTSPTSPKPNPHFIHLDSRQAHMIAFKLDAMGDNRQALLLYNYLCNRHPFNIAYRSGRALLLTFHPNLATDAALRKNVELDIKFLKDHGIQRMPEFKDQIRYIDTVYNLRKICEEDHPLPGVIAKAIQEALAIEERFAKTDGEYPTLKLLIASTYRKAWQGASIAASRSNLIANPLNGEAHKFFQSAFLYLVRYALTLHCTESIFTQNLLNSLFAELMKHGGMIETFAFCDAVNLTDNNRKFIAREIIPKATEMLDIFLSCIHTFTPYMNPQKKEIPEIQKGYEQFLSTKPPEKSDKKIFDMLSKNLREFSKNEIQASIIKHSENLAVLIKFNWKIPSAIIYSWAQHHNIEARIDVDSKWGVCVYLPLNSRLIHRASYQPTPHPNSFLTIQHPCIEAADQPYFLGLSYLFRKCVDAIKSWQPTDPQERISYHLFGNKTLLPSLLLVQRDATIQDALIKLPNGLPIRIILDWLRKNNFAFHWANDKVHGRCLCLTEINLCKTHQLFNSATSNGDIVHPYIKLATSAAPIARNIKAADFLTNTDDAEVNNLSTGLEQMLITGNSNQQQDIGKAEMRYRADAKKEGTESHIANSKGTFFSACSPLPAQVKQKSSSYSDKTTISDAAVPLSNIGIGNVITPPQSRMELLRKAMPTLNRGWYDFGEVCTVQCNDESEAQHIKTTLAEIFSGTEIVVDIQKQPIIFVSVKVGHMSVSDLNNLLKLHKDELAAVAPVSATANNSQLQARPS